MKTRKSSAEQTVRDIRRATRKHYSSEEKIRIVLEGLRGEESVAELCRREGINANVYYRWSKDFLEAGKKRLSGDTVLEATTDEQSYFVSESTVYRLLKAQDLITSPAYILMKAGDKFQQPSRRVNE